MADFDERAQALFAPSLSQRLHIHLFFLDRDHAASWVANDIVRPNASLLLRSSDPNGRFVVKRPRALRRYLEVSIRFLAARKDKFLDFRTAFERTASSFLFVNALNRVRNREIPNSLRRLL